MSPTTDAAGSPSLTGSTPDGARALVLMLHGGADRGTRQVDGRSLSWRRSARMMREIGPGLATHGVGVHLLRYRVKGWNASGGEPSPIPDAREALAVLTSRHPGLPLALLGHSMGARTAVAVAGHPAVRGVVALAPWFPRGEPVGALPGRTLRAAHGRADRITSARLTREYVERARDVGADADFVDMGRVGHYMLRDAEAWNRTALALTLEVLS